LETFDGNSSLQRINVELNKGPYDDTLFAYQFCSAFCLSHRRAYRHVVGNDVTLSGGNLIKSLI